MSSAETSTGAKRKNVESEKEPLSPGKVAKLTEVEKYDSDAEPPKDDDADTLQWRGDPIVTHSDWTIKVVHESEDAKTDTYHVHKFALAHGTRKSGYFEKLLQSPRCFSEATANTSVIRLHPLAAAAFPCLLDYVYKSSEKLKINDQTAVALHHLGQYFGMKHLRWDAKQFWKKDIKGTRNLASYYEHAMIFQDEKMLDTIAETIANTVRRGGRLDKILKLVEISNYELWEKVLQRVDTSIQCKSKVMSILLSKYLANNVDSLNGDILGKLIAGDRLPAIDPAAALDLVKVYTAVVALHGDTEEKCPDLKERCVTVLASRWACLKEKPKSDLQQQGPVFLTELLLKSLDVCSAEMEEIKKRAQGTKKELERTKKEVQGMKKELERTKKEAQGTKKELNGVRKELGKAKKELLRMKKELERTKQELERTKRELLSDSEDSSSSDAEDSDSSISVVRPRYRSSSDSEDCVSVQSSDSEVSE